MSRHRKKRSECKFNSLPARWEHPEKEGILSGKVVYGDVTLTHWSKATTKAVVPYDVTIPKVATQRVSSIAKVEAFHLMARPEQARPEESILGLVATGMKTEEILARRAVKRNAIAAQFDSLFRSLVIKRKRQAKETRVEQDPDTVLALRDGETFAGSNALRLAQPCAALERGDSAPLPDRWVPERSECKLVWQKAD